MALERPQPKIIQIVPWRDALLVLADDGKIYRLEWWDQARYEDAHFVVTGAPVFTGLVVRI